MLTSPFLANLLNNLTPNTKQMSIGIVYINPDQTKLLYTVFANHIVRFLRLENMVQRKLDGFVSSAISFLLSYCDCLSCYFSIY